MAWCFKSKQQKLTAAELYPPQDEHQQYYRALFGGIVDKYLVYFEGPDPKDVDDATLRKVIVYIDANNDIDWQIRNEDIGEEEKKQRLVLMSQLDAAAATVCWNLSPEVVFEFRKLLAVGYENALTGGYEQVPDDITRALDFVHARNNEQSRYYLLSSSLLLCVMLYVVYLFCNEQWPFWSDGILLGVLGAFVSVFTRSGKIEYTGITLRRLHYVEAVSRLCCGAIFAYAGMLLVKAGFLMSGFDEAHRLTIYCIVGFAAGFNERFIPTLIEHFTNKQEKTLKDKNDNE